MTDTEKLIETVLDDRYRVIRIIGKGGMGTVYEGENVKIGKRVAIKVLLPELIRSEEYVMRFQREARAAAEIGHAHIVDVFDFGHTPDGVPYIIMEYLEGEGLDRVLESETRLEPARAVDVAGQVLHALSAAHGAGIIHRDLKPENIFMCTRTDVFWQGEPGSRKRDFVKILDFGISLFRRMNLEEAKITKTGIIFGTPYYMSPEQARASRDIDFRSDIYSVGALLYTMLTGMRPFEGESAVEILSDVIDGRCRKLGQVRSDLPEGLVDAVHRAMAVNPFRRFDSAVDFINALLPFSEEETVLPPVPRAEVRVTVPDAPGEPEITVPDGPEETPPIPYSPTKPRLTMPEDLERIPPLKPAMTETPKTFTLSGERPRRPSRLPLYIALGVLASGALLIVTLASINAGRKREPEPAQPAPAAAPQPAPVEEAGEPSIRMKIELTGTPKGASIYLDGHYFGKLPQSTTVRADGEEHVLRAAMEGYAAEEKRIVLDPAVSVGRIEFNLAPEKPAEEPVPEKALPVKTETKPVKKPIKIKIPSADDLYGTDSKKVKIPGADDLYK
jgi:serine/threonine-protein kinase